MSRPSIRTLLVDNYDSFTFNLFQLLAEVNGVEPIVVKNDDPRLRDFTDLPFDNLVLSPGPGRPDRPADVGAGPALVRAADVPLLGVCLGHQVLAHALGGRVGLAPAPVHGQGDAIHHDASDLFGDLPSPFMAVRYHSHVVLDLPPSLRATAWTPDGLVMAVRHETRPLWGVQFHPESIGTPLGRALLERFRELTPPRRRRAFAVTAPPRGGRPAPAARHEAHARRLDLFVDAEAIFTHVAAGGGPTFWLDSSQVEPGRARFSFVGAGAGEIVRYDVACGQTTVEQDGLVMHRSDDDVLDVLGRALATRRVDASALPFDFAGGWVGWLGHELKARCVPAHANRHRANLPDAAFLFVDRFVALDHEERTTWLVCVAPPGGAAAAARWLDATEQALRALRPVAPSPSPPPRAPIRVRLGRPPAAYRADVARALAWIREGESYELCLTTRLEVDATPEPAALYRALRRRNPAPYAALLRLPEATILSSSPERFLRVHRDGVVETQPIKGTRPRGTTPLDDEALRLELAASAKDRAENLMIVDLARNDLGQVCAPGTVEVPRLMEVSSYATVHQLVSTIRGRLRDGERAVDAVRAAFPPGSMTGAPKRRTLELLDELEPHARGVYAGALGYLSLSGTTDLSVVIRTIVVADGKLTIGTGGAIVASSDAEAELAELLLKARAPLQAIVDVVAPDSPHEAVHRLIEELRCDGVARLVPEAAGAPLDATPAGAPLAELPGDAATPTAPDGLAAVGST